MIPFDSYTGWRPARRPFRSNMQWRNREKKSPVSTAKLSLKSRDRTESEPGYQTAVKHSCEISGLLTEEMQLLYVFIFNRNVGVVHN